MQDILREKLACSYYFVAPALAYGLFTSRLPAIREAAGAGDAQVASLLLALGLSTLSGLVAGGWLIDRLGARRLANCAALALLPGIAAMCLALSFRQVFACALLAGLAVGLCDVAMNAMGLALEKSRGVLCMSFLHAVSGLGGVAGALSGSLFASLGLSPFANAAAVLGAYLLLWPLAYGLLKNAPELREKRAAPIGRLPAIVFACGALSLVCHVCEGSVGSWGSVFLHSSKGAPQDVAALAFAMFTGALVASRFLADSARLAIGDFRLILGGSLLGALGMAVVLLSPLPEVCLGAYALMGFGLGPVVPILFSRAGAAKGVTSGQASALVSVFSYAGLLLFPPFLGYLAKSAGLSASLWLIAALCALQALGALAFPRGKKAVAPRPGKLGEGD